MKSLGVFRAKPNPAGKDRSRYGKATPAQLGAEWVDIKNVGQYATDLAGVDLYHQAFKRAGADPEWEKVVSLTGSLPAATVLRIHSGQVRDLSVLNAEDVRGAEYHGFTGRDAYVWNNAEGDTPALWMPSDKAWVDNASYDPYPPEGAVLVRSGSKLVPSWSAARV